MNLLQLTFPPHLLVLEHGQLGCDIGNSETPTSSLKGTQRDAWSRHEGPQTENNSLAKHQQNTDTSKTQLHMLPFFLFLETPTLSWSGEGCVIQCATSKLTVLTLLHTHTKGPSAVVLYWKLSQQLQQLMACCYSTPCLRPLHNAHPGNGGSHRYNGRDSACCVKSKQG